MTDDADPLGGRDVVLSTLLAHAEAAAFADGSSVEDKAEFCTTSGARS